MRGRCYSVPTSRHASRRPFPGRRTRRRGRLRPREGEHGTVNDYEILLMLDPELPEERQAEILTRTQELVGRLGGTWDAHDPWGRRKLAYEIDHKSEGAYHLLTFKCEPATLDEVSRVLKITDGVMRHMATRRPKPSRRTAPAPERARPDRPERPERHERHERPERSEPTPAAEGAA